MERREARSEKKAAVFEIKKKNFRNLEVWQKAVDLADAVYDACSKFPKHELYALATQMTKAAVSIPSNIAEGHERNSTNEFIQFLGYARGSLAELETQIIIASRRNYITATDLKKLELMCDSQTQMLWKLIKVLSNKVQHKSRFSSLASHISELEND